MKKQIIMKKLLFILFVASLCSYRVCYGQRFTTNLQEIMNYLPRTADDFQSKYYDTDLESAVSVNSLSFTFFEGIPIMKHNGSIKSLSFELFDIIEKFGEKQLKDTPKHSVKMMFDSGGSLSSYRGNRRILAPGVPCSSEVGHGIDLSYDNDMTVEYSRDAQQRVTEAQVLDSGSPYLIFRYSYLSNTKKITTIKGYNSSGNLIGEVLYRYNNERLCELYYKGYSYSINRVGPKLETESKKLYTYDGHGNFSKIDLWSWYGIKDSGYRRVYTFENQYNEKGQLVSSKIGFSQSYNSGRRGGTPVFHTRKYTYDSHDNWVKVETSNNQVIVRAFEYK